MIIAHRNQKGGAGKTTPGLHLAGQRAVWSASPASRAKRGTASCRRWPARHDRVVIDGPPRAGVVRSVLLAAAPLQLNGWATVKMLKLLGELRVFRPELPAWLLDRVSLRTIIAHAGRIVHEVPTGGIAAHEVAARAAEIDRWRQ